MVFTFKEIQVSYEYRLYHIKLYFYIKSIAGGFPYEDNAGVIEYLYVPRRPAIARDVFDLQLVTKLTLVSKHEMYDWAYPRT